jgi:5-formyltetrahydrofolate cyclo-ligase
MIESIREQKAALRDRIRSELKQIGPGARATKSAQACLRLQQEPLWQRAQSVLLYAPLPDELDIEPLWRDALAMGKELAMLRFGAEKQVYVPCRVREPKDDLQPGRFGIMEPRVGCPEVPLKQLDFLVAPGVAFTLDGRRLGRGRGFYDRLLASVRGIKCGIAFDEQIVDAIPAEAHDIRLDFILTPTRWTGADHGAVLK